MRWLFGLLVLANVAVFMWASWYKDPTAGNVTRPARAPINADKIRLLSEMGAGMRPQKVTPTAKKTMAVKHTVRAAKAQQCIEIGPFTSAQSVQQAGARLKNRFVDYTQRVESKKVIGGYRVTLNSFTSFAAAKRRSIDLSRLGIADQSIVQVAENEYSISLGVYRNKANALSRIDTLAETGIHAKLEPIQQNTKLYWLRLPGYAQVPQIVRQLDWGTTAVHTQLSACL